MSETRSAPRIEHRLFVEIDIGGEKVSATTRNVSTGGMFIETNRQLAVGTKIRLRFAVAAQRETIESDAEVRWTEPDGFGIRFLSLRARDTWALGKLISPSGPVRR